MYVPPLARSFVLATGLLTSGCASVVHNVDLNTCRESKSHDLNLLLFRITAAEEDVFNPNCAKAGAAAKMALGKTPDGKYLPVGILFGKNFYDAADPDVRKYLDLQMAREGLKGEDFERMLKERDQRVAFYEKPVQSAAKSEFSCRKSPSGLNVCGPVAPVTP